MAVKPYRFELLLVLVALLGVSAVAFLGAARLDEMRPSPERWESCAEQDSGVALPACADVEDWLSRRLAEAFRVSAAVALLGGVVLGSMAMSREIEHRTAQLGWSMSGARVRWFLDRTIPVLALLALGLVLMAAATEVLWQAQEPYANGAHSLRDFGSRGAPLVTRGLGVFGMACLASAVIGRQLPALLVAGSLAVAIGYGGPLLFPYGTPVAWVAAESSAADDDDGHSRLISSGWMAPDGSIISFEEATEIIPGPVPDDSYVRRWLVDSEYQPVQALLKGSQRAEVELREGIAMLAIGGLSFLGAAVVVQRRRPY